MALAFFEPANPVETEFEDCIEDTHGIVFSISSGNSKFSGLESIAKCKACQYDHSKPCRFVWKELLKFFVRTSVCDYLLLLPLTCSSAKRKKSIIDWPHEDIG